MKTASNVKQTELAWAAGFFDGEGCVHYSWRKPRNPNCTPTLMYGISIGQTDKRVLTRFMKAVGEGNVTGPFLRKPPRKPVWTYHCVSQRGMTEIHKLLCPYLSSIKQQQFKKTFSELAKYKKGSKTRMSKAASLRAKRRWNP